MSLLGFDPGLGRPIRGKAEAMSGWGRPREGHSHAGIDIPVPIGTPVYAMADGQAVRVQVTNGGDAAGIWVGVKHASGLVSRYMHLSRVSVALGARVRRGQQVGLSGNTGISNSGPHLHVDLKAPSELLPAIAAAGGKPAGGWGPMVTPYGFGIPGEPWIPVDSYAARTIADARSNGLPLYTERRGQLLPVLLAVGVGYGIYRLLP
jgi:murein DD-endopeptidase MepM/ murein hydrolase activator NlpD